MRMLGAYLPRKKGIFLISYRMAIGVREYVFYVFFQI